MSYNGIGLSTARGSGTNGYVQRNLSDLHKAKKGEAEGKHFFQRELRIKQNERREKHEKLANSNKVDQDILNHERKRELEVKVMEYRDKLEDDDELDDDEVDQKVTTYRNQLLSGRMSYRDNRMTTYEEREMHANKKSGDSKKSQNMDTHPPEKPEPKQKAYNEKVDPFATGASTTKSMEITKSRINGSSETKLVTPRNSESMPPSSGEKTVKIRGFSSDMY